MSDQPTPMPDYIREKLPGLLMWARAHDHANAVARWPWYGRLIHRLRRCPACAYVRDESSQNCGQGEKP